MSIVIALGFVVLSGAFGFVKYGSLDKPANETWQLKAAELWNWIANYFITSLIGAYLVLVRAPLLLEGGNLGLGDFIVGFIFLLGVFGHLPILSLNITKGIEAILNRILSR